MAGDKNLDDILASIRKIVVEDPTTAAPEPDIDDALLDPDFDTLPLTELVNEPAALPTEAGIDATARALLQPMLQAWLDANLPEIVEAAVAAEIKRLTGHG
jgi:cell pole-organizing protein PopZ